MDDKIKEIIASALNVKIESISENSNIDNIDNWDSLNQMKLIVALEEEVDVEFEDEDILLLDSFQSIKATILNRQ